MVETQYQKESFSIKHKLKKLRLILSGKVSHLKRDVSLKTAWYGNHYGGAVIYPGSLKQNSIVYSFGVGTDVSFDMDIINHHNCRVYGFDPTPKSINWVKSQNLPSNYLFLDYGIDEKTGFVDFYLPKNADHVSGSVTVRNNVDVNEKVTVKMKSLKDIMTELGHDHIDLLKMDIEGAEYAVLDDILKSNVRPDQMLVEFHDFLDEAGQKKCSNAVSKLKAAGYVIFDVSDAFNEVGFIKKELV
jgi:FkbM family methyltransferase